MEIIASSLTNNDAMDYEMRLIALCRNMGASLCNLTDGGEGTHGWVPNEQSRRNMSERNVFRRPEFIEMMKKNKKGKKLTDEHKLKISKAGLGRKRSAEAIEKTSMKNRGRKFTDEQRVRMSAAQKKKPPPTLEARQKMSKSRMGREFSDETRKKISEAKKKPIICSNGMIFDSAIDAALWLGKNKGSQGNISSCCNGNLKTAYGYSWSFFKENEPKFP